MKKFSILPTIVRSGGGGVCNKMFLYIKNATKTHLWS